MLEVVVASAVFALAAAIVLTLFVATRRSFEAAERSTDLQQSTRVAFDRLISDLRLAGFNHNPDGDPTRVDEPIEGAWDTAITLRGDFDRDDRAESVTPESSLAGSAYSVVSIGNDEIVTYVLAKPGPVGPSTLTLRLDPDRPRSRSLKTVTIPRVALIQDDPPYTLYRVTLRDVEGAFPSSPQAAGDFTFEPVADNMGAMIFRYYSESGRRLNPDTPADPADDIGGADGARDARQRIRRIEVVLVGFIPNEDPDYLDPYDSGPSRHFRKLELRTNVRVENVAMTGSLEIDPSPSW